MTFPPKIVDLSADYRLGSYDDGGGNPLNQLVIHFTVSGSRVGTARNLVGAVHRGEAGGATQVYIDAAEVVMTGPPRRKYYATGSALGHNNTTDNIEICGAPDSKTNYGGPDDTWLDDSTDAGQAFINAAWWAAQECHKYEIEPRLLSIEETRDPNRSGITTHWRISMADGPGGSDHGDWDDTEPIEAFVALVQQFYNGDQTKVAQAQTGDDDEMLSPEAQDFFMNPNKRGTFAGWLSDFMDNAMKVYFRTYMTPLLSKVIANQTLQDARLTQIETATKGLTAPEIDMAALEKTCTQAIQDALKGTTVTGTIQ